MADETPRTPVEIDALTDAFDPQKGKMLADLMAALLEAMTGDDGKVKFVTQQPELPLTVPVDESGRRALENRLMELFLAGFQRGSTEIVYPVPGQPTPERSPVDLDLLENLTGKLFPVIDPVDPAYASALRNRVAGVVALLALVNNVQAKGGDTGATIRLTAALARPDVVGEEETHLSHIPWAQRKSELTIRRKAVERALQISILRGENPMLGNRLERLYAGKGLSIKIGLIIGAYNNAAIKFTRDPCNLAQWKNALLKNLGFYFHAIDNEETRDAASDALDALTATLQEATTVAQFTEAINTFESNTRGKVQVRLQAAAVGAGKASTPAGGTSTPK